MVTAKRMVYPWTNCPGTGSSAIVKSTILQRMFKNVLNAQNQKMLVVINGINNKRWGIKCATIVLDGEYNIFDIMEWLRCKVACYTFTC